jgi:1-deoxy-D-xylulose-5-phosphate synthase
MLRLAQEAAERLSALGWDVAVINPRYFKPLDRAVHEFYGRAADLVVTVEDHVMMGGYGSAVLESFSDANIQVRVIRIAWPDVFVEHASSVDYLRKKYGLTVDHLVEQVLAHGKHVTPAGRLITVS